MEVMLKNSTKIQPSTRQIDATCTLDDDENTPTVVSIDELPKIHNFQKINVDVKVLAQCVLLEERRSKM